LRIKNLSDKFINKLAELSAGKISSSVFEDLIELIELELKNHYFTRTSESNLIRIIEGMYDKIFFLTECVKYPHYIELLVLISSNSNYLTDILVINPEYFYWIVNPSTLNYKLEEDVFEKEIKSKISRYSSFDAKVRLLKAMKRKEMLRIGLKDIHLKTDLRIITKELSVLSKSITAELFNVCYNEIINKYKIGKITRKYCVISLGKLGGYELNYSSDIDLIIFYDKNSRFKNGKYYSDLLVEVIQLFLNKSASGAGGFVYRVDLRLRPEGKNAALCRSKNEYLSYYESRGDDWERQMLIKANFLAGSKFLFKQFTAYLNKFIYPSSISTTPTNQINRLKFQIESLIKDEENIKLVPGGIRDIEFSIQALQLLHGGKYPLLQTGNTLESISKLNGMISRLM
jgi:glutamate-ammonia-ligase adenylyltransferase